MMSDEHSTHDRVTGSAGSPDLTNGADGAAGSSGFRAAAGPTASGYPSGAGETLPHLAQAAGGNDEPDTGSIEPVAGAEADGKPGKSRSRSTWRELPILIVVALAIALVIKTFVVQPFFIPSSSMEDTLLIGDKVLVNKLIYHFRSIEPGDIIVFNGVGSWDPAPAPVKPASDPFVRAYDVTLRPAVSLHRRAVRDAGRSDGLHQAGHRRSRRPCRLQQRLREARRAGHGKRRAAA